MNITRRIIANPQVTREDLPRRMSIAITRRRHIYAPWAGRGTRQREHEWRGNKYL
jgi:hypothetical protein